MNSLTPLHGKTAIITGATRGIGRAIALKLATNGANIAFSYLNNDDLAESFLNELKRLNIKAVSYKCDIKDFDKAQEMKEMVLREFGSIDILINNAGITKDKSILGMTKEDWANVIDTNLNGIFNMSKAVIYTFLKQKSGNIINISSISGIKAMPGQTNYSASKGGVISFTRSLAKEVAPYNIRVNAVAPGFIETDMVSKLSQEKITQLIPLNRIGKAEEVADLVLFLIKDAVYITGQVIQIDGGLGI